MNITDIDDKIIIRSNEQGVNFADFAKMWENDYFQDMASLNVQYPNYVTRVSEYVDEIKESIKTIIKNGYAYESNGSVYFDIEKFSKDNHFYKKLTPNSGTKEEADDGEGKLSAGNEKDKRSPGDFALWKKSKENEPFWESEWGKGRPGWHIECSVMCKEIFGNKLDIHCGGVDLKFPHHDNEIAQTEAIYDSQQVKLFLNFSGSTTSYILDTFTSINAKCQKVSRISSRSKKSLRSINKMLSDYTS
jgi:cysteinyl-tRNA synthetase